MPEAPRAPYGRHTVEVLGSVPADQLTPTYYDRPVVKASEWSWLIATYFFVGGLAGAAQVIATIVDMLGHERDRELVKAGRYLAVLGAMASPLLLLADLKTPSRWYNMLRIFRGTSPMSIGSWTLFVFGTSSGLCAVAQLATDTLGLRSARIIARWSSIPAALAGALLATYTGSLLSATSTPLWAAAHRWLPALFGTSATATASAALTLALRPDHPHSTLRRLEGLAFLTSIIELMLTRKVEAEWARSDLDGPLQQPPLQLAYKGGVVGLGIATPLLVHLLQLLTGREMRSASTVASLAALAGGFTQRVLLLMAGKDSSQRPHDYFQTAQHTRVRALTGAG